MKISKTTLLLIATLFFLVTPLIFSGSANAMYMSDGATQNGVTGGWNTPNDMVCIVGVHADGTVDVADGVTNARDCIYLQTGTMNGGTPFDLTGMTTQAACTTAGGTGNDGAKHSWATSFCTKSLKGLDRTQQMCQGIGGTWITTGKCVAYGRQFKGQDANGTPMAFGTKGTTQGAGTGYCYSTMNMTTAYGTQAACPSNQATVSPFNANAAYDWSWSSSKCTYGKGIAGYLNAALTKADGTTIAAGTYVDFSTGTGVGGSPVNTMGACLAVGGSWNNWTGQAASTTSVATTPNASTIPAWVYNTQAPDADNGCLHCHSSKTEYNGPAEREKDSYLQTGHKNMLRKVTPGKVWAGPDGVVYTTDGANTINFMTASDPYGKITVGGVDQNLYYIYGDWMAPLPTTLYGKTGYGTPPNGTTADNNGYSCYACHTTGAKDNSNIGVQGIGTPGYAGVQPQASFPNLLVNAANPKWDLDGIQCSRCHNAEVGPVTSQAIAASSFPTTAPTSGGMGALAAGVGRNNLCFGCHQSIDKVWPAGSVNTTDPTQIPTGVSHGAQYGRDFNGHVLGNSFLNSPHARYTGTITLNSLGKYDLSDPNGTNVATEYASVFKGFTCWQSPTSSSPAKTKADGTEIMTKSDCETLYGAGSWRADTGSSTAGQAGYQGTCATCHDVHNSLFVESQAEAAMRKTCEDCHVNNSSIGATDASVPQVVTSAISHPTGPNTPFDTTKYESACVVCHMATQAEANGNQNSMPVHVWRINTDPNYNTFPTMAQFYGGSCSVHTGAVQNAPSLPVVYLSDTSSANCTGNGGTWTAATKTRSAQTAPDGTYTNAVWVDLDFACGQCHGGSLGVGAKISAAPYFTKADLATLATNIHNTDPTANFTWTNDSSTSYQVNFNAMSSTCPSGVSSCSYDWNFGDTNTGSGVATSHTYTSGSPVTVTLTVSTTGSTSAVSTQVVTPTAVHQFPTCGGSLNPTAAQVGNLVTFTDNTTIPVTNGGSAAVYVNWGDGSALTVEGVGGNTATHSYMNAGNYMVTQIVQDNLGYNCTAKYALPISKAGVTAGSGILEIDTNATFAVSYYIKGLNAFNVLVTKASGSMASGGNVQVPMVPGTYNVYLYFANGHTCTWTQGQVATVTNGIAPTPASTVSATGCN
jgi:PKD domain